MNAFLKAIEVYQRESCARTFNEDLSWYLEHGFVFSRPDLFMMGRPVSQYAGYDAITGLFKFNSKACDCWHVHLFAGNIAPAFQFMPWSLPWISFERNNELRFWRMENMSRFSGNVK